MTNSRVEHVASEALFSLKRLITCGGYRIMKSGIITSRSGPVTMLWKDSMWTSYSTRLLSERLSRIPHGRPSCLTGLGLNSSTRRDLEEAGGNRCNRRVRTSFECAACLIYLQDNVDLEVLGSAYELRISLRSRCRWCDILTRTSFISPVDHQSTLNML